LSKVRASSRAVRATSERRRGISFEQIHFESDEK